MKQKIVTSLKVLFWLALAIVIVLGAFYGGAYFFSMALQGGHP